MRIVTLPFPARLLCATTSLGLGLAAPLAHAADDPSEPASQKAGAAANDIVVTAHAMRDMGLMAGTVELEGDDFVRAASPQIGETLAKLPGVSATSFSPGSSRPVLRGQSGDRVQVLVDGLGSLDLSSVSADHGVALDPLATDHVDVLHGPALLAFGGQAIGGAVIAYDKRIPRALPDGGMDATAIASFSSVADGKSAAGSVDFALGSRLAAHLDASWHDANDLRVGGHVISPQLRAQIAIEAEALRAAGDIDGAIALDEAAAARGRVANSFTHGTSFGGGVAFIDESGNLGVSVQRIDSRYGVPSRPGVGEEGVSIDMAQTRYDLRGEVDLEGFFDTVQLRGAWGDYRHNELEEGGAIGTRFVRKGIETRLELVQAERGGWTGRSGVQYSWGKLKLDGEEAILPDNRTGRIGVFTLQSLDLGKVELSLAGRIERVSVIAPEADMRRRFTLRAGAVGIAYDPAEHVRIGVNYAHGERAPSPEELLTDGAHLATQSYEIGDAGFGRERSDGFEAYARYETEGTALSVTGYLTDFKGFISPIPTGETNDGLPVYRYRQLPARFTGFEAQASQRLFTTRAGTLTADVSADYVRARLKGVGPVPRIPPLRVQGGLEFAADTFTLRGEMEWNDAQRRIAAAEFPVKSFTLVNLSADWKPMGKDTALTLLLTANNLFDVVGRRAASFTRDFVPLGGRDLRFTAKVSF